MLGQSPHPCLCGVAQRGEGIITDAHSGCVEGVFRIDLETMFDGVQWDEGIGEA